MPNQKRALAKFLFYSFCLNLVLSFFIQRGIRVNPVKADNDVVSYNANGEIQMPFPFVNDPLSFSINIKPAGSIQNRLVDIEIYDQSNHKVYQQFYENQNLTAGSDNLYKISWNPNGSLGNYKVKLGIFTPAWAQNVYWNDSLISFSLTAGSGANSATPTSVKPTTAPTAIPTQPAVSQPTATPQPTALLTPTLSPQPTTAPLPVSGNGSNYSVGADGRIYKNGQRIVLKGVSWFGFESDIKAPHGLWSRNWKDMISQIKSSGFNAVRVPYCPQTLKNVPVTAIDYGQNPDLQGLNSMDLMDKIFAEFNRQGMFILSDQHTSNCASITDFPDVSGYTRDDWMKDLTFLADRYRNLDNFIGLDLKNEPKGAATWGTGNDATDWNKMAEAASQKVLATNPSLLVFVEGIETNPTCSDNSIGHWWGGNFEPVNCTALNIPGNKVVYSPHIYGPDVYPQPYFNTADFPANMSAIWTKHFGFLKDQGKAVAPGEYGGKYGQGDPKDVTWQNSLIDYLSNKGICDSFYWSWNPNSGDTGGVLQDDWKTVRADKLNLLNRYWNQCR